MRICDVDGCDRRHSARGLCSKHYGQANPSQSRTAAICGECGVGYQRWRKARTDRCPPCAEVQRTINVTMYQRAVADDRRKHWPQSKVFVRACRHCRAVFVARVSTRVYCTDDCGDEAVALASGWRGTRKCRSCVALAPKFKTFCDVCAETRAIEARRKASRKAKQVFGSTDRHRARAFGVHYEPVRRPDIYERDRWRCQLCGHPVDRTLRSPHPKSPTLDHVIPLSRGGGHMPSNVQLAHRDCNVAKGADAGPAQQLALL